MVELEKQFARCETVVKDLSLIKNKPLEHHLLLCQEVSKLVCADTECMFHQQIRDAQLAVDSLTKCIAKIREDPEHASNDELKRAEEALELAEKVHNDSSHAWLLHIGTLSGMFYNGKRINEAGGWETLKRYFSNSELADASKPCVQRLQELVMRFGDE